MEESRTSASWIRSSRKSRGRLGGVAPGVEVGESVGGDDAARVDHPVRHIVAGGHPVGQAHLAGLIGGLFQGGPEPSAEDVDPGAGARIDQRVGRPVHRRLELGDGAVHDLPRRLSRAVAQGPQGDDHCRCLGRRELERTRQVVRVGHPDHPVGVLSLERVQVDVDQVVGIATRQPAHEQHLHVGDEPRGGDPEVGSRLVHPHGPASVEVWHQAQQADDLVLGRSGGRGAHGAFPSTTAASLPTIASRSAAGDST